MDLAGTVAVYGKYMGKVKHTHDCGKRLPIDETGGGNAAFHYRHPRFQKCGYLFAISHISTCKRVRCSTVLNQHYGAGHVNSPVIPVQGR